jgi:hypothetical protein
METFRSPLVDLFRRGEAPSEVRLLAARGALAPSAHDQLLLIVLLQEDRDPDVAAAARDTLARIPHDALSAYLARPDVPHETRDFLAKRAVHPAAAPAEGEPAPLVDPDADPLADPLLEEPEPGEPAGKGRQLVSTLPVTEKIKLAMRGTREQRGVLVRDANRIVSVAVLSSPKLTEAEVEGFARMANVLDEVLRIIAGNRAWTKNYSVISALARNPKTPPAVSLSLAHRLNERDLKLLSVDRNVPEGLRIAARKLVAVGESRKK